MLLDQQIACFHRYVSKPIGNIFDKYLLILRIFRYLLRVAQGPSDHVSFLFLISDPSNVTETHINIPRKIATHDVEPFIEFDDINAPKSLLD